MKLLASTGGSCTISGRLSKWRKNSAAMPWRALQHYNPLEMESTMNIRALFLAGCVCILILSFHVPAALSQVPSDRDVLLSGTESAPERTAELGGYPAPGRMLELEKELHLTGPQVKSLRAVSEEMRLRAIQLGKRIVGEEQELNAAFRTGLVSDQS